MRIRGKPELQSALAGAYVLGTLRGPARRRFEAWLETEKELQDELARWQARIQPMGEWLPGREVPKSLWAGLERRIPALDEADKPAVSGLRWWQRLGFWRFSTVALAALLIATILPIVPRGTGPTSPMVATIDDASSGAPVAVLWMSANSDEIVMKVVDPRLHVGTDHVLQLWTAAGSSSGMRSAGLVPAGIDAGGVRFRVVDVAAMRSAVAVGLSLEPPGGSPQPTHVVGLGHWSVVSG